MNGHFLSSRRVLDLADMLAIQAGLMREIDRGELAAELSRRADLLAAVGCWMGDGPIMAAQT